MTVSTEPLFAGERFVHMKFYFAPRNPGDPTTILGTITLMPDEENIVLDAIVGPQGNPGQPAPFWNPQWDSTITDPSDLDDLTLGTGNAGDAWYISGYWHIWTGTGWATILGSIPGPPGPMPDIHFSAHGVEVPDGGPYGPLDVTVSGTAEEPYLDIAVPLIIGPQGPQATIRGASDVDNTVAIEDGQVPVWDDTESKFKWGSPAVNAAVIFTVPEYSFGPAGTYSGTWQVIATLLVPALDNDYYPMITGNIIWQRSGLFNSAQIEVHVRALPSGSTNSPETGDLCAKALYDPATLDTATVSNIFEHFSDTANPSRALSPTSAVGRIAAGQAMVYNVLINKAGGSGSYIYGTAGSHLTFKAFPVT